jgi:hypothetical protein
VLLLVQVKPVPPVNVTDNPTQTCDRPLITGLGFTVIVADVFEQVVNGSVNMNDVVPTATPLTTPLGEIVATAEFPPDHVPPVEGVKLIFAPTHTCVTCVGPPKTGSAFITTAEVVSEQPEAVSKNLKVTLPGFTGDTGVIIPVVLPTVARFVAKEVHVPPVVGERVPVLPTQTEAGDVKTGCGLTVTFEVVLEQFPVDVLVNINCTVPADIPVITPALVTEANADPGATTAQVPPDEGVRFAVLFTQTKAGAVSVGLAIIGTVTELVHRVVLSRTVSITFPASTPVIKPSFVTVAKEVLPLVQVTLEEGDN